jgi:arabinofuranosyltransferase
MSATETAANDESEGEEVPEQATSIGEWLRGAPLPRLWHAALGLWIPMAFLVMNMRSIRSFTIDDAYISYRYARNFERGLGLVYNAGERIEGYTNFLWTVILAGGLRLGVDPDIVAKLLGGAAACGSLFFIYRLSDRLRPHRSVPCVATWAFASSFPTAGYAVFGLETAFFIFLLLAGTDLFFREQDGEPGKFPFSGLIFALAGLTRPEAPMFVGILMLFLGHAFLQRQNLVRGAIFAAAVGAHALFRNAYYGAWLPNTFSAKTGNLWGQMQSGGKYVGEYWVHAGPFLWLTIGGLAIGIVWRRRDVLAIAALAFMSLAYISLVGGDWMPFFRFAATFEPFGFLLVDLAVRSVVEAGRRPANLALLGLGVLTIVHRASMFDAARKKILHDEKRFWDSASGQVANWFQQHGQPGEIAMADIGYVGWATDYPVLDLLGLVDPVISKLPGGYTHKTGPGYVERVFDKQPRYFLFVGSKTDCERLPFPAQARLRNDARFRGKYAVAGKVKHSKDGYWCIFERKEP